MGLRQRSCITGKHIRSLLPALAIIVLAGVLVPGGDAVREALRFDRPGLADGQLWRIISGHFVHLGAGHFLLNAAGTAVIALLVAREYRPLQWALVSIAGVTGISLGLWSLNPELDWYVGLSGLLHTWLAAGVVALIVRRRKDGWPLAILLGTKLAIEQWMGPLPGSGEAAGGAVVVDAHLYGAIAGVLTAVALTRLEGARSL